jgi:tight adherence protein B
MTRLLTALIAATALALPAAAGAAAEGPALTELSGTQFPSRGFVLTLPSPVALDESRVVARENGEPVSGLSVVPAGETDDGAFGVVLVIDTSNSMRGRPIEAAVQAARAFAAERTDNQALAIVGFNRVPTVLLPFTTSQERIEEALASPPPLARGTRIYDGVDRALALLDAAKTASGSVIVLSDGADTGSWAAPSEVVAHARRDGVRIFSVGLRSSSFEAAPLEALAHATDGRYTEAGSSGELEGVYEALAGELGNEYLLTYRSDARPDTTVHVAVTVEGVEGVALAEYETPSAPPAGGTFSRPLMERFVLSPLGLVATVLAFAALVAIGLGLLIYRRPRDIRARMAQFVSVAAPERPREAARATDAVLAQAERSFSRRAWWSRFVEDLELAGIRIAPMHILLWTIVGTIAVGWLAWLVLGSPLFAALGLAVPFFVRSFVLRKLKRKRDLFADQLPDNLQVLSSALRAGHSLVGALSVLVDDCPEPSQSEFRRAIADEQLGVSLDQALGVVASRMQSRDLEQVALVAALQRDTGGNTAEVLDRVAETVRGRFELRRLVKTLTTQGRMSRWIVTLLPVGLLVVMAAINPAYMGPLFTHPLGRVMLIAASVMVVAGSLVIKRIINIKV